MISEVFWSLCKKGQRRWKNKYPSVSSRSPNDVAYLGHRARLCTSVTNQCYSDTDEQPLVTLASGQSGQCTLRHISRSAKQRHILPIISGETVEGKIGGTGSRLHRDLTGVILTNDGACENATFGHPQWALEIPRELTGCNR